jgi:hypothetical protein
VVLRDFAFIDIDWAKYYRSKICFGRWSTTRVTVKILMGQRRSRLALAELWQIGLVVTAYQHLVGKSMNRLLAVAWFFRTHWKCSVSEQQGEHTGPDIQPHDTLPMAPSVTIFLKKFSWSMNPHMDLYFFSLASFVHPVICLNSIPTWLISFDWVDTGLTY